MSYLALNSAHPEVSQLSWDWRASLRGVLQQRRLFWTILGILSAVVLLLSFAIPRTYVTQARLIVGNSNAPSSNNNAGLTNFPVLNALLQSGGSQSAETYAELIQETPVAQAVIDRLHLKTSVPALLSRVTVKPVTNTSILQLSARWRDPKSSAAIANAFADALITHQRSLITGQANAALAFLSEQMPASAARLRKAEDALASFQATHRIGDMTLQTQNTLNALSGLDAKIGQVQLDQHQAEAQLRSVQGQLSGLGPSAPGGTTLAPNPALAQLQTQLAQVETQLRSARQQFTDDHPAVKALVEQQAALQREIGGLPATVVSAQSTLPNPVYQQLSQSAATYQAQIAGDTAQLHELSAQRTAMMPQMGALPAQAAQLFELQRAAKLAEDVYTALQQRYNDALITETTALSDVSITQAATAANAVAQPNRALMLLIGFAISLLAALGTVFALDYLDQRVRDKREIERDFALPVLASVPQLGTIEKPAAPWLRAVAAESFLELCTTLRATQSNPIRTVAITSAHGGDGKTTVALNLAIAISQTASAIALKPARDQDGNDITMTLALQQHSSNGTNGSQRARRVLLVDGDLRRPSLHKRLRLANKCGLSDVLSGETALQDAICTTTHGDVDALPSGAGTGNPLKLLQPERLDSLLKECLTRYDVIVFDSPPMTPVLDSALIGKRADASVIVVSAGSTQRGDLREGLKRWEKVGVTNIAGIVLNRAEPPVAEGYYYSGHDPMLQRNFDALPQAAG